MVCSFRVGCTSHLFLILLLLTSPLQSASPFLHRILFYFHYHPPQVIFCRFLVWSFFIVMQYLFESFFIFSSSSKSFLSSFPFLFAFCILLQLPMSSLSFLFSFEKFLNSNLWKVITVNDSRGALCRISAPAE